MLSEYPHEWIYINFHLNCNVSNGASSESQNEPTCQPCSCCWRTWRWHWRSSLWELSKWSVRLTLWKVSRTCGCPLFQTVNLLLIRCGEGLRGAMTAIQIVYCSQFPRGGAPMPHRATWGDARVRQESEGAGGEDGTEPWLWFPWDRPGRLKIGYYKSFPETLSSYLVLPPGVIRAERAWLRGWKPCQGHRRGEETWALVLVCRWKVGWQVTFAIPRNQLALGVAVSPGSARPQMSNHQKIN